MNRFSYSVLAFIFGLSSACAHASDALVREASAAFKRRDEVKLQSLATQLRGHVLESYPAYWLLRLRLDDVPSAQISTFAEKYPGALTNQLRMEWLNEQAKRDNWGAWSDHAAAALIVDTDNADFQCNRAHWQLREGKPAASAPTALWNERLTEACALAFAAYARAKLVTADDVVLRFRLAADGATAFAAKTVADQLSPERRPDEAQINTAHGGAIRMLAKATVTAANREALIYAFGRLARQDMELAEEAFIKLRGQFTSTERAWIALQLGVFGARQHHPDAMKWFKQVADVRVIDAQAAWWVRAALRAGDWPEVLRATEAMSEAGRAEPTWAYWRARALNASGKTEEATLTFEKLKDGFSFYNWLAAEEIKSAPKVQNAGFSPSAAQIAAFDANPAARRAVSLTRANLRFDAAREWYTVVKDLSDEQLIAASAWMQKNTVWDRAIGAAVRTKSAHEVSHRYVVPFRDALFGAAKSEGLEPALVAALTRQESRFAPDVVSSAGAIGLMQLMPNTAKWVAKKIGRAYDRDALEDPATNAAFGAFYLRTVMDGLAGSPVLGLAAYNAGPGRAKNWQSDRPLEGAIYAESVLFNETRDYVKQVLVNAMWIDRIHMGGSGPSLKARLGIIPARGGSMSLAKDTP